MSDPGRCAAAAPTTDRAGLEYHQILRLGRQGWAWPLLGVIFAVITFFVGQVLVVVVVSGYLFATGLDGDVIADRVSGKGEVMPSYLAVVNLGWAAAIGGVWLTLFVVHGLKPRWAASVLPKIRWRWLVVCFAAAAVALVATLVVAALLPAQPGEAQLGGDLNAFTDRARDFLLVIALLTPLQAVGEEYAFRGYLTQAVGGAFRNPVFARVVAVVVPAFVFALAHGLGQGLPIFVDRFAFGLVAGALVIATGGLEAGIAMHVLNNFLAFGVALAFGDMTEALNATGGSWTQLPVTLTQSLVFVALVLVAARKWGIRTRTEPGVLQPSGARV